jgi:outer membrane immunogenic protein
MKTKLIKPCLALAALLLGSLAAQAADLPQPSYKAPAYVAPAYANWSGFYLGLNAGYGFGSSSWDDPAISVSPKGPVAGVTFGYNFQTGLWVWGVEADVDYSGIKGSGDCFGGSCETKLSWLATGRARLGYAGWNNWLPYITGGVADGSVKATSPFGDATSNKLGWTAGLGVEWAFLSNWSAKLEYLYVSLGSVDCSTCSPTGTDNVSFKSNLVRLGVNYRF